MSTLQITRDFKNRRSWIDTWSSSLFTSSPVDLELNRDFNGEDYEYEDEAKLVIFPDHFEIPLPNIEELPALVRELVSPALSRSVCLLAWSCQGAVIRRSLALLHISDVGKQLCAHLLLMCCGFSWVLGVFRTLWTSTVDTSGFRMCLTVICTFFTFIVIRPNRAVFYNWNIFCMTWLYGLLADHLFCCAKCCMLMIDPLFPATDDCIQSDGFIGTFAHAFLFLVLLDSFF